jgi:hypothetical protein
MAEHPEADKSPGDEPDVSQVEATERATRPVRPVLIIGFAVAVVCLVFALVAAARWL